MNRESIRRQLTGAGRMIIRTSDRKEIPVPNTKFVMVGRFNVVVENKAGAFDIIDPSDIVSICPATQRKKRAAH